MMKKNFSNYMYKFFMGSKFYRNYKFSLKGVSVFLDPFIKLNYFTIFDIFKINSFCIFNERLEFTKFNAKNLYFFRFFKTVFLNRFFFISYVNGWNSWDVGLNPIFLKSNSSKFIYFNYQAKISLKFINKFWLDFHNRRFITHTQI